ncbi:MAG: HAD-IIA family hydrolase [Thermodesulfobacteriota bacterium]
MIIRWPDEAWASGNRCMTEIGFLIDMDGVIYRGDSMIPGAGEFMDSIRDLPYLFVTNNSSVTPEMVLQKLQSIGIVHSRKEHVLTSALATAEYLESIKPGFSFYAVGGPGLHKALEEKGREDTENPDFVVVGEGEGLNYGSLTKGINFLLRGNARLIGTNPDLTLDGTLDGKPAIIPGGGVLMAPFQAATGIKPIYIGKPGPEIFRQALKRLGKDASSLFMIGDRPDTDILGAVETGIRTILVCTGRYSCSDPYPPDIPKPDMVVDSIAGVNVSELMKILSIQVEPKLSD